MSLLTLRLCVSVHGSLPAHVVESREETLAFADHGRVTAVQVAEGQSITDGAEVVRVDGIEQRLALAVADADLGVAQAQLTQLRTAARAELSSRC